MADLDPAPEHGAATPAGARRPRRRWALLGAGSVLVLVAGLAWAGHRTSRAGDITGPPAAAVPGSRRVPLGLTSGRRGLVRAPDGTLWVFAGAPGPGPPSRLRTSPVIHLDASGHVLGRYRSRGPIVALAAGDRATTVLYGADANPSLATHGSGSAAPSFGHDATLPLAHFGVGAVVDLDGSLYFGDESSATLDVLERTGNQTVTRHWVAHVGRDRQPEGATTDSVWLAGPGGATGVRVRGHDRGRVITTGLTHAEVATTPGSGTWVAGTTAPASSSASPGATWKLEHFSTAGVHPSSVVTIGHAPAAMVADRGGLVMLTSSGMVTVTPDGQVASRPWPLTREPVDGLVVSGGRLWALDDATGDLVGVPRSAPFSLLAALAPPVPSGLHASYRAAHGNGGPATTISSQQLGRLWLEAQAMANQQHVAIRRAEAVNVTATSGPHAYRSATELTGWVLQVELVHPVACATCTGPPGAVVRGTVATTSPGGFSFGRTWDDLATYGTVVVLHP